MAFDKKFYLIKFLVHPYPNAEKYVCVPNSWIVGKSPNKKVYVAYPNEDPAKTRRRAENIEKPRRDWKIFEAKVECESNDFENADIWAAMEAINQSTDDEEFHIVEDDDSTDDADHEVAIMHNNASSRNKCSNIQTAFREKLKIDEETTSSRLNYPLAGSSKRESLPIHNPLSRTQEMVEESNIRQEVNDRLASYLSNLIKTTAMSTSSKQSHQLSKSSHLPRISVVSENFLRYGGSKQALVPESSKERNGNVLSTQEMLPATQTLIDLMKHQLSQMIQENTSLNINRQPSRQKLRGLGIPDKPTEVNCIPQRSHPPNVTKNTPSAVPKCANTANLRRSKFKRPQKRLCPPAYQDSLPKNVSTNRVVITSSTGVRILGNEKLGQSIENNAAPALQNLSNPAIHPGQIVKQSHEEQSAPAYNVIIQRNSQVNRIIITNANEVQSNDRSIHSQSIWNNASYTEQMCEHISEQPLPPASREHLILQQNPYADNVVVRTTTGGKPLDLLNISGSDTKRTPPVQHFPSIKNKFGQIPKASNQFQTPVSLQNDVRPVTHTHWYHAGECTTPNDLSQRSGLQDTRQNTPAAVTNLPMNQPLQISENPHQKQSLPVLKAHLPQDPHTKLLFLMKAREANGNNQTPPVQSATENVPPAPQTVPISTNQSNQPFNNSYKNQFEVDCSLHEQRILSYPSYQTVNPQNIRPDIPFAVQNPSYSHPSCSCICSHGRELSSVTPSRSAQDPRVQDRLISQSKKGNSGRQSVYPEPDTETRSSAKKNSTNLATYKQSCIQENQNAIRQSSRPQNCTGNIPTAQSSPVLANQSLETSMAERHSPMNVVNKLIGTNSTGESKCLETATKDGSTTNQNSSNVINKFENDAEAEQALINDFKLLLSQMNSSLSSTFEAYKDIRSANIEYDKTFKKIIDIVTDEYESRINQIRSSRSKKDEKPRNKQKRKKMMKHDDYDLDDHDDNEECYKPSKKRSRKNSFVLPPEYDPENSRWTLKHQKASAGIVEIMPRSRVYIDAIKFSHCKRTARDCKTLARMLMTEIFSENALRVCSLTGAKATAFDSQEVRPGLDEHARIVMLTFVEEYGRQNDWVVCDTKSILNSVRSKVQEIRRRKNKLD